MWQSTMGKATMANQIRITGGFSGRLYCRRSPPTPPSAICFLNPSPHRFLGISSSSKNSIITCANKIPVVPTTDFVQPNPPPTLFEIVSNAFKNFIKKFRGFFTEPRIRFILALLVCFAAERFIPGFGIFLASALRYRSVYLGSGDVLKVFRDIFPCKPSQVDTEKMGDVNEDILLEYVADYQEGETMNLLLIATFNISYVRGLFPEKYFSYKSVPALGMKIKELMPMDAESRRLIDWIEKGVYDALQKKYLRTLMLCVCEAIEGPMIEEYAFSFSYSNSEGQEVSMNVNRIGNKKQGGTFKGNSTTVITLNQMRSSACKMVRTLIQLMRTLDKMPEERTILMKLLYYDDVTPVDYEPPFFRGCSEEEAHNPWNQNPLKMEVGNVNSRHFVMALKVKSVLDPCGDENDNVSLGADSIQRVEHSDSDSKSSHSEDEYIVTPVDKEHAAEDVSRLDDDDTKDTSEDEQQLSRVKDWITTYHLSTIELSDVHSNFADLSWVLIEEIMDSLVEEGIITKTGTDCYTINKPKGCSRGLK